MPCNISNRERCGSGASKVCASCSTTSMLTATCSGLASLLWRGGAAGYIHTLYYQQQRRRAAPGAAERSFAVQSGDLSGRTGMQAPICGRLAEALIIQLQIVTVMDENHEM